MYPEFIAIYVMLSVVIVMLGAVLFFLFKFMKNGASNSNSTYILPQQNNEQYYDQQYQFSYQEQYPQQGSSVVFCKQCATQFDSSQSYCPQCGTHR